MHLKSDFLGALEAFDINSDLMMQLLPVMGCHPSIHTEYILFFLSFFQTIHMYLGQSSYWSYLYKTNCQGLTY